MGLTNPREVACGIWETNADRSNLPTLLIIISESMGGGGVGWMVEDEIFMS